MTSPLICAEISANHLGSLQRALAIVDAAADAGADAVKVQTWASGTMCVSDYTLDHGPWAGRKLRDLYEEAWLPWAWHKPVFDRARERGLVPFSAAFDQESVDFLETLGVARHKCSSFELVDLPLIRYMASKRKPMILSTGMASAHEIDRAIAAAVIGGAPSLTVLTCTSAYPAKLEQAGLGKMFAHWDTAGVSDHTLGAGVAIAATALGASYIEKHLTLSRADGGPDAGFSMEPDEFKRMVTECRQIAAAMEGTAKEELTGLRRSLWVVKDTKAGDPLILNWNIRTARPALGAPCDTNLHNKRAACDLRAGTPLTADAIA